jgi:MerR family transcriptional regulator, light-induced transcriptional regulator
MSARERKNTWPDLRRYSDTPLFNTKAVAQQTGIPAPTLRAWERRYAILSPERANNAYRLYSERDMAKIRWLKERVDDGMSISQAAALLRHMDEENQRLLQEQPSFPANAPVFHVTLPAASPLEQATGQEPGAACDALTQAAPDDWLRAEGEYARNNEHISFNLHTSRAQLLEAFRALDENSADMLMASMLAIYPVELVCSRLIVPTLWEIGNRWETTKISVSVEHFASCFFRGILNNLLHLAPRTQGGPPSIVCCAPGEPHELASLMLALFLRRAGLNVLYLGQSIEISGLLNSIEQLSPPLVCVSLTMPAYLAALIELGRQIQHLPAPQPRFAFGGQVFVHYSHLISQVPGMYLDGDLQAAVAQIRRICVETQQRTK